MRRGQYHVKGRRLIIGKIQLASGVDVRFNTLQQLESIAAPGVDIVDGFPLLDGFRHRHPACDL
jgi:hypothetical protein